MSQEQKYHLLPYNQASHASTLSVYLILGGLIAPAGFQALYTQSYGPGSSKDGSSTNQCGADTFRFLALVAFLTSTLAILLAGALLAMVTHLRTPRDGYVHEKQSWGWLYSCWFYVMQAAMGASIVCWIVAYFVAAACFFPGTDDKVKKALVGLGAAACVLMLLAPLMVCLLALFKKGGRCSAYNIEKHVAALQVVKFVDEAAAAAAAAAALRIPTLQLLVACQEHFRLHESEGPLPRAFLSAEGLLNLLQQFLFSVHLDEATRELVIDRKHVADVRQLAFAVIELPETKGFRDKRQRKSSYDDCLPC